MLHIFRADLSVGLFWPFNFDLETMTFTLKILSRSLLRNYKCHLLHIFRAYQHIIWSVQDHLDLLTFDLHHTPWKCCPVHCSAHKVYMQLLHIFRPHQPCVGHVHCRVILAFDFDMTFIWTHRLETIHDNIFSEFVQLTCDLCTVWPFWTFHPQPWYWSWLWKFCSGYCSKVMHENCFIFQGIST